MASYNKRECFDLLGQTTDVMRGSYSAKQNRVGNEISKEELALEALKIQQMNELNDLIQMKAEFNSKAQHLAGQYKVIKKNQKEFTRQPRKSSKPNNHEKLITAKRTEELEWQELIKKVDKFQSKIERSKNKVLNFSGVQKRQSILIKKQEEVIEDSSRQIGSSIGKTIE